MFRPRRLVQSVLALLLLAVFADSAAATEARLLALGADGDFLEDVGHARRWYGCLASYPDLVLAELGDYLPASSGQPRLRRQSAGAHLALDAPGRWGTAALYLQADDADEGGDAGRLALAWGRRLGGWQVGALWSFRVREAWLGPAEGAGAGEREADFDLGIGTRKDLGDRLYLDLAAETLGTTRRYLDPELGLVLQDGNWRNFSLRGRAFWGPSERVAVVPVIERRRRLRLEDSDFLAGVADLDARETLAGLGVNLLPGPDVLIVASYAWRHGSRDETAVGSPPGMTARRVEYDRHAVRLGLEARVMSWLTLRAGARQLLRDEAVRHVWGPPLVGDDAPPAWSGFTDAEFDLSLGLGVHLGPCDVDLVVDDEAPYAFGDFLTGGGEGRDGANFTRISLLYVF